MDIVTIDGKYIDYLRKYDSRVCFNKDGKFTRPYIGVVFSLRNCIYFAPLTSSGKGVKLKECPKKESVTFFPIDNCRMGGININNMIPVLEEVIVPVDLNIKETDTKLEKKYKVLLMQQLIYCITYEKLIREKANKIYSLKVNKMLYPNYDAITCDFKLLEKYSKQYPNI